MVSSKKIIVGKNYIPYTHHYMTRFVYFLPHVEDHFFVFNEVFSQNSVLMYGYYLRAASNQEWARVRYKENCNSKHFFPLKRRVTEKRTYVYELQFFCRYPLIIITLGVR